MKWFYPPTTKFVGYCSWLLFLASWLFVGVPAHAALTDGLIAYFPFNGNANDESGNGNNGTVHNATLTTDKDGTANSAYYFDGSVTSYIDIGSNVLINTAFTESVWIKAIYTTEGFAIMGTHAGGTDCCNRRAPSMWIASDTAIHYGFGSEPALWSTTCFTIDNVLNADQWNHIVTTFDGVNYKLYTNGIEKYTSTQNSGKIPYPTPIKYIGTDSTSTYYKDFWGTIDEVRVYNRAITAAEVAQLYQGTIAPTVPAVSTDAPSLITATSAILKGTVNPNGADTLVNFDFGATTTYGQNLDATPASIAATAAATSVSATKTGLTCGTTYHYRVTAVNSVGPINGPDKAFTTTACPVDFVITGVVLTPALPVANGTFTAAVTVKNQGAAAGDGGQLRLWANQPTVQVCAATGGDKTVAVGTLAAGASKVLTVSSINAGIGGIKTIRAFVDAACVKTETNETNNQFTKTYRVTGKPDFVVTSMTLTPATPAVNGNFSVAVTVKNQGTAAGDAGYLDVWNNLATAATCGADSTAWADVGILAAGASKTLTVTGLSAGAAGTKTARAYVDSWCEFVEGNEINNQLTKAYTVQ